ARNAETLDDGRRGGRMLRRSAVLPSRAGTLRVEVPAIGWWDVAADRAREAVVSPLEVDVAAAVGVYRAPRAGGVAPADAGSWVRVPGVQGPIHRWALATVVFALLWL